MGTPTTAIDSKIAALISISSVGKEELKLRGTRILAEPQDVFFPLAISISA